MRSLTAYIARQLFAPFIFFFLALSGIIWLTQSLRSLDLIINKGLSAGYFFYMTLLILPGVFTIILPIALFAAVLYTFYRLNSDSELVVIWSAGISSWRLARPALLLAVLGTVATFALTLYFMPAGYRAFKDMKTSLRTNLSYVLLQEGAFNRIGDRLTVYIRARQPGGEMLGILVHDNRDKMRPVTMMAERGALIRGASGPRFVMVNGNRQEIDHGSGSLSLLHFDRYTLDLAQFVRADDARWLEPRERFLDELFSPGTGQDDLDNLDRMRAEAHDRLISPLYGLAFVMIALATMLSGEFNRRGYGWRVMLAIGLAVAVRLIGLGLLNLAAKHPIVTPLLYLNVGLAIAGATIALGWHRDWRPWHSRPRATSPGDARGTA